MTAVSFQEFPNSFVDPFFKTSDFTPNYNCIAWAYEDPTRWYWPDPRNIYYWPNDVPRKIDLDSFIELFSKKGYQVCPNDQLEPGFKKIAIFIDNNGIPTHAARQLINGFWTSKLGRDIDVQHTINSIIGGAYGNVGVYMRCPI